MDNDMLAGHIKTVEVMTAMIPTADIDRLVDTLERVDAVMPLIDPTAYRASMGKHHYNKRCVAAFKAFHTSLAEIKADMEREAVRG